MAEPEARILDELNDLLDAERTALLQGNIDGVHRLMAAKERLLRDLSDRAGIAPPKLLELRHKIARNHELLASSVKGIVSVAQRFAAISKVRKSLEIYDRSGCRMKHPVSSAMRLESRA